MRTIELAGRDVPLLGQGTWKVGDRANARAGEIAALQRGIDLGLTLIDTAEMYGEGASERLVGEAIRGRRDAVTLVSKVYPHNAGRSAMPRSCEASLTRLGVERLDLYLLHWRGGIPLTETVEAFERLKQAGKIATWGVSNFAVADLEALIAAGGTGCAANQILYNVTRRGIEFDLLPWMAARAMVPIAYSPVEQGRLPAHPALAALARQKGVGIAEIALAFTMRTGSVIAIPKATTMAHVEANRRAADIVLDADDLRAIDAAFPPPSRPRPLDML